MSEDHSITHYIANLKAGQDVTIAQHEIWNRYFRRLVGLARRKLGDLPRRDLDEEDIVVSALACFFEGVPAGKFSKLTNRESLWPLLAKITARKAINQRERALAKKRGGGMVRGESVFMRVNEDGDVDSIDNHIDGELTPEFADDIFLAGNELIQSLDDEKLRIVAIRKLQGYTTTEIASELGCVARTVERKLMRIRAIWSNTSLP